MTESLSLEQARRLILLSQRVPPGKQRGTAVSETLSVIDQLSYIQIDTISVVQRAHHHTLWNRNPRYKPSHLDALLAEKRIFEYWTHAAAYLPMSDYRYSLPRKQAFKCGEQKHWFKRDEILMKHVLDRISSEGPLMAKDFNYNGDKIGAWGSKPAKQSLENLFVQGELMIASRRNFHKVYDLTHRVLPEGLDTSIPSPEEHARFLITRFLGSQGIGQVSEITYLLKQVKPLVTTVLQDMIKQGELHQVQVEGIHYVALPQSLELLNRPLPGKRMQFLSPFDNLIIQRKRTKALFGFDYILECYYPAAKRKYGYFSLPILWDGRFVARLDCKVDRKQSILNINQLSIEDNITVDDEFMTAFSRELDHFMDFNDCLGLQIHQVTPELFKEPLKARLREGRENT